MYCFIKRYTCSCNLPGSLGFEEIDVQMLLDFEVDYFKYDNCYPKLDGSTNCLGIPQIKVMAKKALRFASQTHS